MSPLGSSLAPTRVVPIKSPVPFEIEMSNFYGLIANPKIDISKNILHGAQINLADLCQCLKRSGSVDFSDVNSEKVIKEVFPDVIGREESYQFSDDDVLDEDDWSKGTIRIDINEGTDGRLWPKLSISGSDDGSEDSFAESTPEQNRARYLNYLNKMRSYFNKKGVADKAQQDRILYSILQGRGLGASFTVPEMYLLLLGHLSGEMIRPVMTQKKLSLSVANDGSGDVFVTMQLPLQYFPDKSTLVPFDCGMIETTLHIPKNSKQDIQLTKAKCKIDPPNIVKSLAEKCRALKKSTQQESPQPPDLAVPAVYYTPKTSPIQQSSSVEFWGRAKDWYWDNKIPLGLGALALGGLFGGFLYSGGAILTVAALAAVGFVMTEAAVIALLVSGLVLLYAAATLGQAIGHAFSTGSVPAPKPAAVPQPQPKQDMPSDLPYFQFDPPFPQFDKGPGFKKDPKPVVQESEEEDDDFFVATVRLN